jgi:CubicO group peptidase (beta-lactamase class C family)
MELSHAPADSLSRQVDLLFDTWHRPDSPGAAVLVMHQGEVVHARGYGMASLEHGVPIRPGTVFDIASVSKQFAGYAIALLEADGALDVDDDVRRHIPELPDFGRTITIRHLLHHTSGLRDWPGSLAMAGWDWEDVLSYEQILRMAYHQVDLNFDPGSEYAYSNTGYNLLAEVVARVSGQSFRAFCQERIFEPLGMRRTHFHDDHTEVVPGRAASYRPVTGESGRRELRRVTSNLTAVGSSSLFTTVEDLARWIRHLEDPSPDRADAVARIHERGVLTSGDTIAYAWGQNVDRILGVPAVSHGGSWAGYRSTLTRFPEQGLAVVILANTSDMNAAAAAREIARIYLGHELPPPEETQGADSGGESEPLPPWRPSPDELAEFEGEYTSSELSTSYRLQVQDGLLVATHFRTGDRTFAPTEPDHFRAPAFGDVHFLRDDDGRITGFTANQTRIRGLRFDRVRD